MKKLWLLGLVVLGVGCDALFGIDGGMPDPDCAGLADDMPLANQVKGDCVQIICDRAGRKKAIAQPEDVLDDGNPCTDDVCVGVEAKHPVRESVPCYTGPEGTEGVGQCVAGHQKCNAKGELDGSCMGEVLPGTETCYEIGDENCNGQANEAGSGCQCVPGTWKDCYTGPAATLGVGACRSGQQQCQNDGLGYGACIGEQTPQPEHCDVAMFDDDCDGQKNEDGGDCVCGDGIVQPGEECDDGGTADGDACSPTCKEQRVLQIAAGANHTCALLSGGIVKCWGLNTYGQLGLGEPYNRGDDPGEMGSSLPPVNLGTGQIATAIAAGNTHTCALLSGGIVKCWGFSASGQLGLGDTKTRGDEPNEMGDNLAAVELGTGAIPIAIGCRGVHSCALLSTGALKCWGNNSIGELGLGDTNNRGDGPGEMGDALPAVDLGAGQIAKQVTAGGTFTCTLLQGGWSRCWGIGGLLGRGDTVTIGDGLDEMGYKLVPVPIDNLTSLFAGISRTCGIRSSDSALKCWGSNQNGSLGLGDTNARGDESNEMGDQLPVVDLGTGKTAKMVGMGTWHTCAVLQDGTVKCWGGNNQGQLGLEAANVDIIALGDEPDEMGDKLPVVKLGQGMKATSIAVGISNSCVVLENGSVKCWGTGTAGKLGQGDQETLGDALGEMGDNLPPVKLFSDKW